MLKLRPYKACDADEIAGWFKDEYTFRQWSADRYASYPLAPKMINDYYEAEKFNDGMWEMTAFDENGIVGHMIMRFPSTDKNELRFGFIAVNDKLRGKGYGKQMLLLAIDYAFLFIKVSKITLGVFENNERAKKCYLSCGFREIEGKSESYRCMGETWKTIEMELIK